MSDSALAAEITREVLRSVVPLFEDVKSEIKEFKTDANARFKSLELKVSGLGVQMDMMDSKIDTALELTTAVPRLEEANESTMGRLKRIEKDLRVLKLAVSKAAK